MAESIVSAYRNKYEDEDTGVNENADIQIVFVKRKRFKLTNLVLDKCGISETGPAAELEDICSKVTECDLSHNDISSWAEVFKLLETGKQVAFLNLSNNKLSVCESVPRSPVQYPVLQDLVLCANSIQWDNLLQLLPCLPALKQLNVGHNNLTNLNTLPRDTDPQLPDIVELNLINNKISCFSDVADVAHLFPNLTTLVLSDNPVSSFGSDQQAVAQFGKIDKLHLNYITIETWDEVSKLRWFPSLNDVRMVHWNLFGEMDQEERRKMLAALLPNIYLINGSPIPERDDAERWYLRRCQAAGDVNSNRYKELYEKWGELPELTDITLGGKDEKISLKILVPERGVEIERTFSIYDTYLTVRDAVSRDIKIELAPDRIQVQKPNIPYKILVRMPGNMLYMTFKLRLNPMESRGVGLENGDSLVYQLKSRKINPTYLRNPAFVKGKNPHFLRDERNPSFEREDADEAESESSSSSLRFIPL